MEIRDAANRKVPRSLLPVFAARQRMVKWCDDADVLAAKAAVLAGTVAGEDIRTTEIRGHLEAAKRLMMLAAPFTGCGCNANHPDCPLCKNRKWLTAEQCLQLNLVASPAPTSRARSRSK